ncbi:MAG TPA: LPS assembly protein LptD [Myxococcaceae bacterium]|nr:LPS assembly protein LptD [Myxococcaceae bacterium]
MTPLGLVLVLLAQAPATPLPAEGEPVRYQAGEGTSDGHGDVLHLKGKAQLRTDTARIEADRIDYDQRTRIVTATGHCYAVTGLSGAVADGLTLDLDGNWLQLQNGRFFVKADVAPAALLQTSTPEQLISTGRTTLAARVERVERVEHGHLKVNGLDFTPCDCNPLEPHWSIKATAADVHPGERAWLFLPVIYVYGVPILPLPVLDVPLKAQKSGLLVTTPAHSAQNGWQVTQPVYFALASNWDLTVTPGYTWGSSTTPEAGVFELGVKGPSLDTEFRWAHSRDTKGDLELFLLDDRKLLRDPRSLAFWGATADTAGGSTDVLKEARGFRGSLNGAVLQNFGGGWSARLDLNLVSDAALVKDTTTDVAQQANQYLRSSAVVSRRTPDSILSLEVTARQDIAWGGFSVFDNDRWPYPFDPRDGLDEHQDHSNRPSRGQWLRGPATLQRLPTVHLDLPSRPLGEHFSWAVSADVTRLAPFNGHSGDEGVDGIYQLGNPSLVDPGSPQRNDVCPASQTTDLLSQGDRVWQCGEREARLRLDLVPKLSGSFGIGDWLRILPSVWIRQDLYLGEVTRTTAQRGYVVGDLLVSSEVSRTFASGLRHAIQPSLEYREIPGQWGAVPGNRPTGPNQPVENRFYDEIDGALMDGRLRQGVARLTQTLSRRTGALMQELLRVEIAQEFDFHQDNGLGDTVASLRSGYGPFSAGLTFRYDSQRSAPGLWAAFASFQSPRFGSTIRFDQLFVPVQFFDRDVYGAFAQNLPAAAISGQDLGRWGGAGNMRQGIDALVGSPVPSGFRNGQRQSAITLEAHVNLVFGLGLTYSGTLYPAATWTLRDANGTLIDGPPVGNPPTAEAKPVTGRYSLLGQQNFGVSFAPACNCWRLDIIGRLPPPFGQYVPDPQVPGASVRSTFNWRFPDLIFLLTIQNFGTFGAS